MIVPAVTISPSLNLVRAKSLASPSVANVLDKRGCRRSLQRAVWRHFKSDIPSVIHAETLLA